MSENNKNTQVNQTQDQTNKPQKQKKGIGWWLSAITGKAKSSTKTANTPGTQNTNTQAQNQQPVKPQSTEITEDSVKQDLAKLKKFFGKVNKDVHQKVDPVIDKSKEGVKQKGTDTVGKVVNTGLIKKIVTVFVVIVLLMVLVAIGMSLFNRNPNDEPNDDPGTSESTPTSQPFVPYTPSVYAKDLEILKLDEEISTLEREFASSDIKETPLSIPELDFDIEF